MFHTTIIRAEKVSLNGLHEISFDIEVGYWYALAGPAGSGKSALLSILAGLQRPENGRVYIEGREITALPEGELCWLRSQKIGMLFQHSPLPPALTVLEYVEAPLYIHPPQRYAGAAVARLLDLAGLGGRENSLLYRLSPSEQRRAALARALVRGPEILLADEPAAGLEQADLIEMLDLLRRLRNRLGLTVVMATRDMECARRAERRICVDLIPSPSPFPSPEPRGKEGEQVGATHWVARSPVGVR